MVLAIPASWSSTWARKKKRKEEEEEKKNNYEKREASIGFKVLFYDFIASDTTAAGWRGLPTTQEVIRRKISPRRR